MAAKKSDSSVEKIVDQVAELSVLELSELVEALQDKLGVSAMAPVAAPVPGGTGQAAEAAADDGGNKTVVMTDAGGNKIQVIKALRAIDQNLGLKEAKDMTESLPAEILKDAKAEEAKEAADKLKEAGASVELK